MPALEMAQETGKLVSWMKKEGRPRRQGRDAPRGRDRQGGRRSRGAGRRHPRRRDREGRRRRARGADYRLAAEAGREAAGRDGAGSDRTHDGRAVPRPPPCHAGGRLRTGGRAAGPAQVSPKRGDSPRSLAWTSARLAGLGPGGEIVAEDVQAAAKAQTPVPAASSAPPAVAMVWQRHLPLWIPTWPRSRRCPWRPSPRRRGCTAPSRSRCATVPR